MASRAHNSAGVPVGANDGNEEVEEEEEEGEEVEDRGIKSA